MEHNRGSKFQSIISVESRKSNKSFSKSLGRPSWEMFDGSCLDKKASLVYAMSIQSQHRKSDIFQRLLQSQKKPKYRTSNLPNGQSYIQNSNNNLNNQKNVQRNSQGFMNDQNQVQIDHNCGCFQNCQGQQCECFNAKEQMCIKGTCCKQCVQMKLKLFRGNNFIVHSNGNFVNYNHNQQQQQISNSNNQTLVCNCKNTQCLKSYCKCFQNGQFCSEKCGCQSCKNKQDSNQRNLALQMIKNNNQVIYCTCKKTKCNKKYCSCYASGIKCGKHCSCQNCANCQKNNDMDVQVYEGDQQEDYKSMQMPQKMSFQPVNFD